MSGWVFHDAQWGDLTVLVMPRVIAGHVYDSNVGVVTKAPYHKALLGGVVVNNGREPRCEAKALNRIIMGDDNKPWTKANITVYTVPTYRLTEQDKNESYMEALADMRSIPDPDRAAQAEANLESVIGWCTDSISCASCGLCIPGHFPSHVIEQARAFGWGRNRSDKAVCPAHELWKPFPTDEEIAEMEK